MTLSLDNMFLVFNVSVKIKYISLNKSTCKPGYKTV
jgi:hypothetical protein